MSNFQSPQFVVINPESSEVLAALEKTKSVGFDLETSISKPRDGIIRLYQLYVPENDTVYIWDIYHHDFKGYFSSDFRAFLSFLSNPNIEIRIHNVLFEYSWIREKHQLKIQNILDTLVLSQVKNAGLFEAYQKVGYSEPNSLETLSELYGLNLDKQYQKYDYSDPSPITLEVYQYAANDAKATWYLGEVISRPKQDVDLRAASVFGELNYRGIPVNVQKLVQLLEQYEATWKDLYEQIKEITECNPNSPKQLLSWIINKYGKAPLGYHRKKKAIEACTKKSAVNDFIFKLNQQGFDTTTLRMIQEYRSIKKRSDYPKEYLSNLHEGRIYGNYKVFGFQGEGRSSCAKANIQNVAKSSPTTKKYGLSSLRSLFEAEPGWTFIEIDLAAAHAQIARAVSRDRKLVESLKTGIKLHFYTLQSILAKQNIFMSPAEIKQAKANESHPYHLRINELYKLSKNVYYSFLNFSGATTLQDTFSNEDVIIDVDTCKEYLDATAKTFSDLRNFQKNLIKLVENRYAPRYAPNGQYLGLVSQLSMPDGSIIHFIKGGRGASKICAAVWLRVEASAIKQSLISIQDMIDLNFEDSAEIVNFSHDSVLLHAKEEVALDLANFAYKVVNRDIRQYVKDYQPEEEYHYSCWLPGQEPKKGELINKTGWVHLGYELKKNWEG
ncbi:MAG: hypothetical protein KME30_17320 [Iphinoe sp. HA4291-MV1]|jgi:DNA polymerase I-like protein with 3'-5' exonuclease and polymerase domains|nr:hypothetical protein [Iphinoe sp. HA4291-MV1]